MAFAIPATLVWVTWLYVMAAGDRWHLFATEWYMSVTMAFGSFIAGATSEGGGAVAFPVMTLVFNIPPVVARDFSLMIQTVGMNSAAFMIFFLRIPVELRALLWASVGGVVGMVLGLELIHLPPAYTKMFFVSTWLAFAFALYWINRYRTRKVHPAIVNFGLPQAILLVGTGTLGGVISAVTGSGIDITTFSLLVLYFRISEKIATPTSVVLMAFNAAFGFLYKGLWTPYGMEPAAWGFWYVCVPVVVVGAPFGAWFIRNRSRLFISGILYTTILAQFVWAIVVLGVYRQPRLAGFSILVLFAGLAFFRELARGGARRMRPPRLVRQE